jgi:hypothetical protein
MTVLDLVGSILFKWISKKWCGSVCQIHLAAGKRGNKILGAVKDERIIY